jgi:hypothetical protein
MGDRHVLRAALTGVLLLLAAGCASTPDAARLRDEVKRTPAKLLSSYSFDPSTPLADRVQPAPGLVIDYLRAADRMPSYAAYAPTAAEREVIRRGLEALPAPYARVFADRLVGIWFVSNLVGSGMADYVLADDGTVYTTLVVNPETLRHDLSAWLTYRESTVYAAAPGLEVQIDCGTAFTGFTYVLLHEGGHVMDYVEHHTPYVEPVLKLLGSAVPSTPFAAPVWREYAQPAAPFDFPLRAGLRFYGMGKPTPMAEAVGLYTALMRTPFASLYGSMNWAEDFAEFMTWYYLVHYLGQPYEIQVLQDGTVRRRFSPMRSAAAAARAREAEAVLGPR